MRLILFAFLCILFVKYAFGQQERLDSLKLTLPDTVRMQLLGNLSSFYRFRSPDSAFFYGEQALTLARRINSVKGQFSALQHLAVAHRTAGNTAKALELQFKSFQLAENNNLDRKGDCLQEIGQLYFNTKDMTKGLFYFREALRVNDAYQRSGSTALALWGMSTIFCEINELDSAEYYAQLTSAHVNKYNLRWMKGNSSRALGMVYHKKGNTELALDFLQKALHFDTAYTYARSSHSTLDCIEIAKVFQAEKRFDSAIYYAHLALDDAQRGKLYTRIIAAGKLLTEIYESIDEKKALAFNKITVAAYDSLSQIANQSAFNSITGFDEKERQYEIETAQAAYKNKTRQYALLAGIGVFLLIAFVLYRNNKKQKKANHLLHQQKEEINSALSQLKATQAQLIQSEKMASLGELTAGIAHEIQNPLNFVNNFSEVSKELVDEMEEALQKDDKEEAVAIASDIKDNLQKIGHHGKRADAIVKGMLEHSRTSRGEKQPTDINALADEYLRLSYHGFRAKDKDFNANFKTHFDESIDKIEAAPQDIGRVLLNLYNNAFYSVDEKKKQLNGTFEPTVSVTTKRIGDKIEISVRDNGTGISQQVLDKIFQPFFTTKPTGQGTGLGLSLSYDIITKGHRGEMKVETREGEGAEFIVLLPS